MAKIGLIDVDSHNFPNLALMKLSAWHKQNGDEVGMWNGLMQYDRVYQSKVFDGTYSQDNEYVVMADEVIKGGTGYGLDNKLPDEVEHICPDYSLYGITDTAYGFLTRGCPRACSFCIVSEKEGLCSRKVADLDEWWKGQKNITLLDPNLLASKDHEELLRQLADSQAYVNFNQGLDARLLTKDNISLINKVKTNRIHFAWDFMKEEASVLNGLRLWGGYCEKRWHGHLGVVYVLCNFNTTHEEDVYRVETLKAMNYDPYIMIYDKPNAPKETRWLSRYVNNRLIFRTRTWEDYKREKRKK